MTTESDLPTFTLTLQLGKRGDVQWTYVEGLEPRVDRAAGWPGGWVDPDEVQRVVRRELAVAIPTWLHRLRRHQEREDEDAPAYGRHRRDH